MRTETYKCDVCGSEGNPTPPKWVVGTPTTGARVQVMDGEVHKHSFEDFEDYDQRPPSDVCSDECALKEVARMMKEGPR